MAEQMIYRPIEIVMPVPDRPYVKECAGRYRPSTHLALRPNAIALPPPPFPLTKLTQSVSPPIMDQTAPHSARTDAPAPSQGRKQKAVPTCIAALLSVVRVLLGYAKHLDQILPDRADHPHFPTLAAGFGTYDMRRILSHVQRGILRAMMLQRFLLARAAQNRDIEPTPPPGPAEPEEIEGLDIKLRAPVQPGTKKTPRARRIDPDHPAHFHMPTLKELEAQVRCRSVGRTIAEICADLGIWSTVCEGEFWSEITRILAQFGGNFEELFDARERRKKTFEKERQTRPDTWTSDLRDQPREAIRQLLGYILGESPPRGPPDPLLLTASS